MNTRAVATVVGILTAAFGLAGLVYPRQVMDFLDFSVVSPANPAGVLGEVRATYGGMFSVIGLFTVFAGLQPGERRLLLLFVGALWLGACAGRLLGVYADGSPGAWGWSAAILEFVIGAALLAAALLPPSERASL